MRQLYKHVSATITITLDTDEVSVLVGCLSTQAQHIIVFDLHNKQSKILSLVVGTQQMDYMPYDKDMNYSKCITYIYNLNTAAEAHIYAQIFPYKRTIDNMIVRKIDQIYTVAQDGTMGVYNDNNSVRYLVHDQTITTLLPRTPVFITTLMAFASMTIRTTQTPSNVAYEGLTESERHIYMPQYMVTKGNSVLNARSVISNWVPINNYIYNGTLTYVPTRDKNIHLVDEENRMYVYTIDLFRSMIPYLFNGVIKGSFKYSPRGNMQIRYILIPHQISDKETDIIICDSESSGSEDN